MESIQTTVLAKTDYAGDYLSPTPAEAKERINPPKSRDLFSVLEDSLGDILEQRHPPSHPPGGGESRARHLLNLGAPSHRTGREDPQQRVPDRVPPRPFYAPQWAPGDSHILGRQRPSLHHSDTQRAAPGHGAQSQTFQAESAEVPRLDQEVTLHVTSCGPRALFTNFLRSGSGVRVGWTRGWEEEVLGPRKGRASRATGSCALRSEQAEPGVCNPGGLS